MYILFGFTYFSAYYKFSPAVTSDTILVHSFNRFSYQVLISLQFARLSKASPIQIAGTKLQIVKRTTLTYDR